MGAALSDVLTLVGIRPDAVSVLLVGLVAESPEGGFRYVLPVDKASHPDTLLAYALNGETLPKDHGYPLRALVPGWVGSTNIKWLGQIVVSSKQIWTRNNTSSYVFLRAGRRPLPATGGVAGQTCDRACRKQRARSALAGGAFGAAPSNPRIRSLPGRQDLARGMEHQRWTHMAQG